MVPNLNQILEVLPSIKLHYQPTAQPSYHTRTLPPPYSFFSAVDNQNGAMPSSPFPCLCVSTDCPNENGKTRKDPHFLRKITSTKITFHSLIGMARNLAEPPAGNRGVFFFWRRRERKSAKPLLPQPRKKKRRITKRRVSVRDGNRLQQVKERGGRGKLKREENN